MPEHFREEVIQNFQGKIFINLNKNDPTYEARKEYYENAMEEEQKKRQFQEVSEKTNECLDPRKTKMIVEFTNHESASIKSFAVKKINTIKATNRLMNGKLIMFATFSLKSFIYESSKTMCFPDETASDINKKYDVEKVEIFHILTDMGSTSLKFIFICDPSSDTPEDKFRDVIFEVIVSSKIYKRFDSSHEFWRVFEQKEKTRLFRH